MPPEISPITIILAVLILTFLSGIRIIRPVEVALVERLGKYNRTLQQ